LTDDTDLLLVIRIGGQDGDEKVVFEAMRGLVEGDLAGLQLLDMGEQVDWARLDKVSYRVLCYVKLIIVLDLQVNRDQSPATYRS
jgi:hypothetical protein